MLRFLVGCGPAADFIVVDEAEVFVRGILGSSNLENSQNAGEYEA
jgi:hypothetical protein